jgi:hypothetical protein
MISALKTGKPMKLLAALILAVALDAPASAVQPARPSAEALLHQIERQGGRTVLWNLWQDDKAFDAVIEGIESGDPAWLDVAVRLRPFSDAGASESIDYAVASLLPRAPRRVLSLVGHGFEIRHICTSPFIEPAPGVAEAYETKALAALAGVRDRKLAGLARECARRVRLPRPTGRTGGA